MRASVKKTVHVTDNLIDAYSKITNGSLRYTFSLVSASCRKKNLSASSLDGSSDGSSGPLVEIFDGG